MRTLISPKLVYFSFFVTFEWNVTSLNLSTIGSFNRSWELLMGVITFLHALWITLKLKIKHWISQTDFSLQYDFWLNKSGKTHSGTMLLVAENGSWLTPILFNSGRRWILVRVFQKRLFELSRHLPQPARPSAHYYGGRQRQNSAGRFRKNDFQPQKSVRQARPFVGQFYRRRETIVAKTFGPNFGDDDETFFAPQNSHRSGAIFTILYHGTLTEGEGSVRVDLVLTRYIRCF